MHFMAPKAELKAQRIEKITKGVQLSDRQYLGRYVRDAAYRLSWEAPQCYSDFHRLLPFGQY